VPQRYLEQVREPGQTVNPLLRFLGVEVEEISPERAVLSLVMKDEFIQGAGVAAGGILATLMDEAMAHAAIVHLKAEEGTTTVELSVRYLKACRLHDTLRAEARVVKRGGSLITVEGEVTNGQRDLTAKGLASFLVLKKRD
jgi:uncharacterized protein (TIGR00369 family)